MACAMAIDHCVSLPPMLTGGRAITVRVRGLSIEALKLLRGDGEAFRYRLRILCRVRTECKISYKGRCFGTSRS